ncbi:MAG: 5-formyltetrahydrofolate cyclo-ligase [Thermoprotei archaeon]
MNQENLEHRRIREDLRKKIWDLMEATNLARFPRPVHGRIPNFVGAEESALKLLKHDILRTVKTVEVNPDAPQRPVRELMLRTRRRVVMPTPRISRGFLLLDPDTIPEDSYSEASTIKGAFKYGEQVDPWSLPKIDLIVAGSVVVDVFGGRLGKGEGYSELEYGILIECRKISLEVPIVTTVHDVQVIADRIPLEPWDFAVDWIITPTKNTQAKGPKVRPKGILWEYIEETKLKEIPILNTLLRRGGC